MTHADFRIHRTWQLRRPLLHAATSFGLTASLLLLAPGCDESSANSQTTRSRHATRGQAPSHLPKTRDLGEVNATNIHGILQRFRGHPVLLNLWATWCPPCRREMPVLAEFARTHPKIVLMTVSMDGVPHRARVRAFLNRLHVGKPRFLFSGNRRLLADFSDALGVRWRGGLPVSFVFDASGTLRGRHLGPVNRSMLERLMRPVLSSPRPR